MFKFTNTCHPYHAEVIVKEGAAMYVAFSFLKKSERRGEHFSSLHFQCDVPAVSVWCVGTFTFCVGTFTFCVGTFTFCVGSSRLMCRPDEDLSLRTFLRFLQTRCSIGAAAFRPRSRAHDAGLSPCARNTMREAISRRHVEQPACRTRCPKEPHAQRSWQLQRSPPAQSEDAPIMPKSEHRCGPEVWLPS